MSTIEHLKEHLKNRRTKIIIALSALLFLLFLYLQLFLSKECLAATTYSWIASGEDIKINNKVFTMYISTEKNLLVKKDSTFMTIRNNSCDNIDEISICVLNVTDVSGKLKAYIRTYYNTTVLSFSRTLNRTQLHVGERIIVNVTINNTANFSVPFKYSDELPEGLFLVNGSSEFHESGILSGNQVAEYSYEIIALKGSTYNTRSKLEYEVYGNKEVSYSSLQTIVARPSLNTSFYLNRTEILVGEETRIDINITNFINETRAEIELIIPNGLEIENSNISCQTYNLCKINSSIPQNSTKSFFINVKGKRFGSSQIILVAKNSFEEVRSTKNLVIKSIEPSIFFSNSLIFESDEEVSIKAYMQNPSTKITLKNISILIYNDLIGRENLSISEIGPMQRVLIINKTITTPKENSRKAYKLTINSAYFTEYGDFLKQEFAKDIVVEPVKEITITHSYKNRIESYEETFFEVSVKNNRKENLTITLEDNCPNELLKSNQSIKKTILAYAGETVNAYSYRIKAPKLNESKEYYIQTTATYNYSDEIRMISKTSKLEVVPRSIKISLSQNLPSGDYEGNLLYYELQIANSFREPIYNILVLMPEQENYDFERTKFFIKKLNPEEQASLKTIIRPKTNGTLIFGPLKIIFEDEYGNLFEQNSTQLKISVNPNYISEPAVIANKSCFLNGSKAFLSLRVRNIGNKRAEIRINELGNLSFSLEPGSEKLMAYELSPAIEDYAKGYLSLGKTALSYNILGKEYTAYSNSCFLNLSIDKNKTSNISEQQAFSEKVKQNKTAKEILGQESKNESIKSLEERRNFFREFMNSIIRIFYVKREK